MVFQFYVLGFGMKHWVLCNAYGTCSIRLKWKMGILECLQEGQDTKEDPKNWQVPEVDFLSNRHPAKSASEKA
jgi:hypothetical protein